ncbi:MAG: hypothetical protein WCA07_03460 [Gloeobacterales cyanobacterium]
MLNVLACPITQALNSTNALNNVGPNNGGFMSWLNNPSGMASTALIIGSLLATFWLMQKQAIPPATGAEVNLEEFSVNTAPQEAKTRELVETK